MLKHELIAFGVASIVAPWLSFRIKDVIELNILHQNASVGFSCLVYFIGSIIKSNLILQKVKMRIAGLSNPSLAHNVKFR